MRGLVARIHAFRAGAEAWMAGASPAMTTNGLDTSGTRPKKLLVTGGAGFIGSALVRHAIRHTDHHVLVVDKLTYAGNLDSLAPVSEDPRYLFARADITDGPRMRDLLVTFQPDVIMHLAAESHVDRSIDGPGDFIRTNIVGTYTLLEAALTYWREPAARQEARIPLPPCFDGRGVRVPPREPGISPKGPLTIRARLMRRPRPARIIWFAPGTAPTDYRRSSATARTTMAPIIFPRS